MSEPWLEGRSRQMPGVLCNPLGGPQSKIHALLGCHNPDAIDDLVFCNPPDCIAIPDICNPVTIQADCPSIEPWSENEHAVSGRSDDAPSIATPSGADHCNADPVIQSSTIMRIDEGLCSSNESLDKPPILAQSIQFWKTAHFVRYHGIPILSTIDTIDLNYIWIAILEGIVS